MKYDLYNLIYNFTDGYNTTKQTKYATAMLLGTVLEQISYDLDIMCQLNNNSEGCKNIEDYLTNYQKELKNDIENDIRNNNIEDNEDTIQYKTEEKYIKENKHYNTDFNLYKNSILGEYSRITNDTEMKSNKKRSLTSQRVKSRKSNIKSSRNNLRKHRR